jgi:hypothetical protein
LRGDGRAEPREAEGGAGINMAAVEIRDTRVKKLGWLEDNDEHFKQNIV